MTNDFLQNSALRAVVTEFGDSDIVKIEMEQT